MTHRISGFRRRQSLPSTGCLLMSPSALWHHDQHQFVHDVNTIETVLTNARDNFACDYLFGMPISMTGAWRIESNYSRRIIQSNRFVS
jgi:hypothetical protein